MSEFDFQILHLTDQFYDAYPNPLFSEILQKQQRAYHCLLFQSHYDYYIFHQNSLHLLHPSEFKRRYSFSSLKYFHKELHINETSHSSTSKCSPLAQGLPTSHLP